MSGSSLLAQADDGDCPDGVLFPTGGNNAIFCPVQKCKTCCAHVLQKSDMVTFRIPSGTNLPQLNVSRLVQEVV